MSKRRGRSRKQGQRHPAGQLVQSLKGESPKVIALRQPHRREAPTDFVDDARAETPLGILNMIGAIPNLEYGAARRYAQIVRRYRAVIQAPSADPSSLAGAMEPKRGGQGNILDAVERKWDYDQAFEALQTAGKTAAQVVARMAVHGEPCASGAFPALIRGLKILVEHFDLTSRSKSRHSRNAS